MGVAVARERHVNGLPGKVTSGMERALSGSFTVAGVTATKMPLDVQQHSSEMTWYT